MDKDKSTKKISVIALTIAIIGLTIVYIAMSRTINMINNEKITQGNWNIHFENLSEAKLTGESYVISDPKLNGEATLISGLDVGFTKRLDSVTYTFDVVNSGDIDAKIGSIINSKLVCNSIIGNLDDANTVCENIGYKFFYTDNNNAVEAGDYLGKNERRNLTLRIFYDGKVPTNTVRISNLSISVIYVQK